MHVIVLGFLVLPIYYWKKSNSRQIQSQPRNLPDFSYTHDEKQAILSIKATMVNNISVGYALAYPGAIMGIILSMVLTEIFFSLNDDFI